MGHSDKKPISEENALSRMMRICSRKEYSTFDIRQKLYKLGQDAETIDKIIAKLIENKFIDDERYTRSFVSDKIRFSKWGEKKIRYTLSQKQIPTSIIDNVLEELEPEELTEHLMPIIKKKYDSTKADTEYDKRTKVIRFALSRGFAMNEILKCLDKISTIDEEPW